MSGHSKWNNTKHRKARQDKKKSTIFTKITREIMVAVKLAGKDPNSNFQLRKIINKALSHNMKRKNINHAINHNDMIISKKSHANKIFYGGHGPNGVVLLLSCRSNNHQKTVSNIKYVFSKLNYSFSIYSSVKYLFQKKIQLMYFNSIKLQNIIYQYSEHIDSVITINKNIIQIICNVESTKNIQNTCNLYNQKMYSTKLIFMPAFKINNVNIYHIEKVIKTFKFYDEIKNIYHNINL